MNYLLDPICAETWDTYEGYKTFCELGMHKGKHHRIKRLLPPVLFFIVFLSVIIYVIISHDISVFFIDAILVPCYLYYWSLTHTMPQKMLDRASEKGEEYHRYIFANELFYCIDGKEASRGTTVKQYADIQEIYDLPDAFYIFFDKTKGFIVDKTGFTVGTPDTLGAFLREKVGEQKYIQAK